MKMLWRLSREAIRYRTLYVIAILATLGLTAVNLGTPHDELVALGGSYARMNSIQSAESAGIA